MIPKVIHYCWFGRNPKPKLVQKCIQSWQKYCPDFQIIEWNEENVDIDINWYVREAYEQKKWAFVSDYFRLKIIYEHGGIYLDTDVELIKSLEDLLLNSFYLGTENEKIVNTGLGFGAEKKNKVIGALLNEYEEYIHNCEKKEFCACPELNTAAINKLIGDYHIEMSTWLDYDDGRIFAKDYFSPKDFDTKVIKITDKTYSIHHFDGSWLGKKVKIKKVIKAFLIRMKKLIKPGVT